MAATVGGMDFLSIAWYVTALLGTLNRALDNHQCTAHQGGENSLSFARNARLRSIGLPITPARYTGGTTPEGFGARVASSDKLSRYHDVLEKEVQPGTAST